MPKANKPLTTVFMDVHDSTVQAARVARDRGVSRDDYQWYQKTAIAAVYDKREGPVTGGAPQALMSTLYCNWEYHFANFKSKYAALIYNQGLRVHNATP